MSRVLIAGCGDVGSLLGIALVREGHEVWGLRRRADLLPRPLRPIAADLGSLDRLVSLPPDLDAVVYAAAADRFDDVSYESAYVDGPRNLLRALRRSGSGPGRFVFTSSTAVYGEANGEWVDEDSPTDPRGFSGTRLLEGEQTVLASETRGVVLRLGGIYGPGRTRLVDEVRSGRARLPIDGPNYTNRIHLEDCAGALRHLLLLESPAAIWLGVDHDPADRREVLVWLADRLGVPRPAFEDVPAERKRGGNKRCRNDRLVRSGYEFRYPTFREGYAPLLPPVPPFRRD